MAKVRLCCDSSATKGSSPPPPEFVNSSILVLHLWLKMQLYKSTKPQKRSYEQKPSLLAGGFICTPMPSTHHLPFCLFSQCCSSASSSLPSALLATGIL